MISGVSRRISSPRLHPVAARLIERLAGAFDRASDGQAIRGAPSRAKRGVGKSRLLAEISRRALRRWNARTLIGWLSRRRRRQPSLCALRRGPAHAPARDHCLPEARLAAFGAATADSRASSRISRPSIRPSPYRAARWPADRPAVRVSHLGRSVVGLVLAGLLGLAPGSLLLSLPPRLCVPPAHSRPLLPLPLRSLWVRFFGGRGRSALGSGTFISSTSRIS